MEPFTVHRGRAVPLRRRDVDTDQIIPAEFLKRTTRTGFSDGLFATWRRDPSFVLNDPRFEGATVLVAGRDFGIGSSREHAVWALQDYGFRVVVSSRFGDIFRQNALKGGLLPVPLDEAHLEALTSRVEADPRAVVEVDLRERTLTSGDVRAGFEIDDYARWRLLEGLDDIAVTFAHGEAIAEFEAGRPSWLPRTR